MYNKLEQYYKKNSKTIKLRKTTTIIYIVFSIAALSVNYLIEWNAFLKTILLTAFMLIVAILSLKLSFILNEKKIITIKNKKELLENTDRIDLELIESFLRKESMLNKTFLEMLIGHYRIEESKNIKTDHLLEIILASLTVSSSFLNIQHSNVEEIIKSITTGFLITLLFLLVYYAIKEYYNLFMFYTGKNDIYKVLEEKLTELYLKQVNKK